MTNALGLWTELGLDGSRRAISGFRWRWPLLVLAMVVGAALPVAAEPARAPSLPRFTLVTVGPGSDLFELWGHSALCVSAGPFEDGMCYDYGWTQVTDPVALSLGTLRGQALFVRKKWPAAAVLRAYQFRDVWKQELPLDGTAAATLLARLEADAEDRRSYSYEPLQRNCTTRLRDAVGASSDLHQGTEEPAGAPLRKMAEAGLSGRVVPLVLLALAGGASLDRPTSEWQRMALPFGLMESVRRQLGAAPERLFSRLDQPPPTSPHAGRIVLFFLAVVSGGLGWRARRASSRARLVVQRSLGLWLTFLSLVPIAGTLSVFPSLSPNWLLLVLVPTDLVLLLGDHRFLQKYLVARLVVTSLALSLSLTGLLVQDLWAPCLLVLLPFSALLLRPKSPLARVNHIHS